MRRALTLSTLILVTLATAPLMARDSLGVFGDWGAFRDPEVPRCYAIAMPTRTGSEGFATVSHWPARQVRGQLHLRLSRTLQAGSEPRLVIGGERFALTGAGRDAWAQDRQQDARIVAALRAAATMQVSARDSTGRLFTDSYRLDGAATAIDAASVGCARAG